MKSLLILLTAFISGITYANNSYEVKSSIKKVIVYQQGAQIKRQGTYSVKKGITELKIRGISPTINPNTLQIKASGNIVILDSKYNVEYPEPTPQPEISNEIPVKIRQEIKLLQDSLFDISYELMAIQSKIDLLNNEKRIIENNGTIKGQGKVNDSIPLLEDALAFYHKKMNSINIELLQLNREKSIVTTKQTRMTSRLNDLNNYNRNNQYIPKPNPSPIHEIIVTVSANENASGKLTVTYLVSNAGWTPLYDLRSNNLKKSIDLTYKAQVYQSTGIDWKNTRLSLSTNNPYTNKTKPNMSPWYLDYYNNYRTEGDDANLKKSVSEISITATTPGHMDYARDDIEMEEEKQAISAEQFMTTIEQLISVEYSIDLPYTIKSDNKKNMVLVKTESLDANYMYYTVPKLDPGVYLIAKITNLDDLNLIPGNATIFHDGSYLGSTYLNTGVLKDTIDLSLGKTTSITVKRRLMKNATKEKIVGDKVTKTFSYEIEVRNHSKQSIQLIVEDQIPITRNEEIEIELDPSTKGKLDELNGFVTWKGKIKPLDSKVYKLSYSVRYAKNKSINLALN